MANTRIPYASTIQVETSSPYGLALGGEKGDKATCPRCEGKVFEAERMVTRVGNFHKNCFSCIECNKKLDSTTCCEGTSCCTLKVENTFELYPNNY